MNKQLHSAVRMLERMSALRPTLAIVLGSGFGEAMPALESMTELSFESIPGFAPAAIKGHVGAFSIGSLGGTPLLVQKGRIHFYEGHPMERVTFPVRVMAEYGIRELVLTNAAGGISPALKPGDLMAVTDHINLMGVNPLRGELAGGLPQFVDLTRVYDPELLRLLAKAAKKCRVRLKRGVYLAVSGPTYETPAEIRAFASLGADAVGMSTVPEAIVARQCGLRVAAVSCITNLAAGRSAQPLSHSEVLETGLNACAKARRLLQAFVEIRGR